jgi:serine phosphatase RsbU (regulator of sigma subunit)
MEVAIPGEKREKLAPVEPVVMNDYLASLRYAGVIQKSLLPLPATMDVLLSDYFVTYLPRDYVSGDFYYVYRGRSFFCVAAGDCTGHGVPGALLSILGLGFLNEIIHGQPAPKANRILNMMREKVMKALHQSGKMKETRDSIDMAICIFTYDSFEMQYSGANRPLFIVRNNELREIKPDKMPIGLAPLREDSFTNRIISFDEHDMFYLSSDGFPDQFGGADDKKYKSHRFREFLSGIAALDTKEQKQIIEKEFSDWKGNSPQIDDVMVFGFKPLIKK